MAISLISSSPCKVKSLTKSRAWSIFLVNITLNKNSIPYETLSPFKTSGIRIGAAAITARGFGGFTKEEMLETPVEARKVPEVKF